MSGDVDPLQSWIPKRNWRWNQSSHLASDDVDELHAFAARIGMKRSWFQNHGRLAHYDLNVNRRRLAVRAGAIELTRREFYDRFLRPIKSQHNEQREDTQ